MIALQLDLNGQGWDDLTDNPDVIYVEDGELKLAVRPHGTASGEPSVLIRIDVPSGHVVVTQTSWRLLSAASQAIAGQYGWLGGMER